MFRIKFTGNTQRYTFSFFKLHIPVSSIQSNLSTYEKNCILLMSFDFKRWLQKYLELHFTTCTIIIKIMTEKSQIATFRIPQISNFIENINKLCFGRYGNKMKIIGITILS